VSELPVGEGPAVAVGEAPAVWMKEPLVGIDTGSGKGGFLSAVELPALRIFESR
jgi:hypothetical protein